MAWLSRNRRSLGVVFYSNSLSMRDNVMRRCLDRSFHSTDGSPDSVEYIASFLFKISADVEEDEHIFINSDVDIKRQGLIKFA